jgi:choline transport protein
MTFTITVLLSLINIGSTVAFNAIGSLAITALLASYFLSISCMIFRRTSQDPLPPCRWSLGRAGVFVNVAAVAWLLTVWIFLFFPLAIPVTPSTMNWNSLIFGSSMLFAMVYYVVIGHKTYTPPVMFVKRAL